MIRIFAPATTANLGSGFDVLGAALDFGNELEVYPGHPFRVTIAGEGSTSLPRGTGSLIVRAYERVFEKAGLAPVEALFVCRNRIPLGRGLGSSAAAALSGAVAALAVMGSDDRGLALEAAIELEGHPDNVVPCLAGGVRACYAAEGRWHSVALPVPEGVSLVLVVPRRRLSTEKARRALGSSVPLASAAFNLSRVALLVHALERGALELLRVATEDEIHQRKRLELVEGAAPVFDRLRGDGLCLAAWLSGAGSTMAFLVARDDAREFQSRAEAACADAGLPGRVIETAFSPEGLSLEHHAERS